MGIMARRRMKAKLAQKQAAAPRPNLEKPKPTVAKPKRKVEKVPASLLNAKD